MFIVHRLNGLILLSSRVKFCFLKFNLSGYRTIAVFQEHLDSDSYTQSHVEAAQTVCSVSHRENLPQLLETMY